MKKEIAKVGLEDFGRIKLPLQFSNASSAVNNLAATGMNTMVGMPNVATNNLGSMPNNQMNATGVPVAGGVPGLADIEMSLGLGGDRSNFGSGVGVRNSATAGIANPGLMAGSLNALNSSTGLANTRGGGLGTFLTGSLGATGLPLGSSNIIYQAKLMRP